jgi:Mce-associated membrane protein
VTTGEAPAPAEKPRRRGLFSRRRKSGAAEADEPKAEESTGEQPTAKAVEAVEALGSPGSPEGTEAPGEKSKAPMGKAARVAKTRVVEPETPVTDASAEDTVATGDVEEAGEIPALATDETGESGAVPSEEVVYKPFRPAGRRLIVAAVVASILFVGAAGFAGAMAAPYLSQRAQVETKLSIARTATNAITTLWTYTPDDMSTLADRASRYLSGDFANEYRKYIDAIIEPNKQAQVTNTTQVMGAAVESVDPPGIPNEATAIVYTNSVATSPVTKNIPSLRYLSYRLEMQRHGGDWLITRMSTITSFDLTPRL